MHGNNPAQAAVLFYQVTRLDTWIKPDILIKIVTFRVEIMKPWQNILLGVLFGLLTGAFILIIISRPVGTEIQLIPPPTPSPILVHVDGAVQLPGVYPLPVGSRIQDAVKAAGGFSDLADPSLVNLAARLKDGDKITIPTIGQTSLPENSRSGAVIQTSSTGIDINTATAAELEALPGIGPGRAEDIVKYRESHGSFTYIEEIMNVPGIGQSTFDQIKDLITLSK